MFRHKRVEVDQMRDSVRHPMTRAANYHTSVTVTNQYDFSQILKLEQVHNIVYMGLQPDLRSQKVHPLTQTG